MIAPPSADVTPTDLQESPEEENQRLASEVAFLSERFLELEDRLQEQHWEALSSGEGSDELSRTALDHLIQQCRAMYLKNPLIRNGVNITKRYVFGLGVSITAQEGPVNDVLQGMLDDRANRSEWSSRTSQIAKEQELLLTGNVFLALFTVRSTGRVRAGSIPVREIREILSNPNDGREAWYYRRVWTPQLLSGAPAAQSVSAYYPDWRYQPRKRPTQLNGVEIRWDSPVYHVKDGGFDGAKFGIPDVYAALDWATAARKDLQDFSTLRASLARFAWRATVAGGKPGMDKTKERLGTTLGSGGTGGRETNPPPVAGSTAIVAAGNELVPISKSGTTPNPEDSRRIWLMVAAAMGIPETILSGNAEVGNLATAKTLDRPTELKMETRRSLWEDVFLDLCHYQIEQAVRAQVLPGRISTDELGSVEVELSLDPTPPAPGEERSREPMTGKVDVEWPSILAIDVKERVDAIVAADQTGRLSPEYISREFLLAFGADNVDEEMALLYPPEEERADDQLPGRRTSRGSRGSDRICARRCRRCHPLGPDQFPLRRTRDPARSPRRSRGRRTGTSSWYPQ